MANPNNGMYMFATIQDMEVKCLIDTGASINIMAAWKFRCIPANRRPALRTSNIKIRGIDGSVMATEGCTIFKLKVVERVMSIDMVVAETPEECVLGLPFLRQSKARMGFGNFDLRIGGVLVPTFDSRSQPLSCIVRLAESVSMAVGEEYIVPGRLATSHPDWSSALFEPSQKFPEPLFSQDTPPHCHDNCDALSQRTCPTSCTCRQCCFELGRALVGVVADKEAQ